MQTNVNVNSKKDFKNTNVTYYVPIFYTYDWQKKYVTVDDEVVDEMPDIHFVKKFKTHSGAKSFGMRKWQSSYFKGYIIKEVICPVSD